MRCFGTLVGLFLPCATVGFLCKGPPHHAARRSTAPVGQARSRETSDDDFIDEHDPCHERHSEFSADIAAFESSRGQPLVRVGARRGRPGDTDVAMAVTLVLCKRRSS